MLKSASILLLVAGLSVGVGTPAFLADARAQKPAAEKPAKPADGQKPAKPAKPAAEGQKPAKPEKPAGVHASGTISSADEKAGTVTIRVPVKGTKQSKEETYTLAKDGQIVLQGLTKQGSPGKFADLVAGAPVSADLTADAKTITRIYVGGLTLGGGVKSVDPAKNTITVTVKEKNGAVEKTIELMKDGKVIIDDGLGKKTDPPKEGKLADLTEGTPVSIQLSAQDRTKAVAVRATGPSVHGTVKGIDIGNNTITITSKGENGPVETTYPISKEVRLKGNLADIVAGTQASLRLAFADKKTVVAIATKE